MGAWIIDLDGVIWLAGEAIPGSAGAVERLRSSGTDIVFATNNAEPTRAELVQRLARVGITASDHEIVSSADAAASMLEPGSSALACGGAGLVEALTERGVTIRGKGPVDAVLVGMTRAFDYEMLSRASLAVRAGARLVGTNEDPTHPTPSGLLPGSGALVAAVATAAQTSPELAGKPHEPMVRLLRERAPKIGLVVGDRPATDGLLAKRLGCPFGLVLSGVISPGHGALDVEPDEEDSDLAALVRRRLGSSS
ncbi:MAG TPA: HAD-IIA family hydrolase [Acidimicrobiales bacterium]|nr:HAD-IIA family hydrolase [Acidimicrobiales bacterium]